MYDLAPPLETQGGGEGALPRVELAEATPERGNRAAFIRRVSHREAEGQRFYRSDAESTEEKTLFSVVGPFETCGGWVPMVARGVSPRSGNAQTQARAVKIKL